MLKGFEKKSPGSGFIRLIWSGIIRVLQRVSQTYLYMQRCKETENAV